MAAVLSEFGAELRRRRQAAGLTQEALAERAGLSARGISDLERGLKRSPYPDTVARLADALGLSEAERAALATAAGRRLGGGRQFAPVDPLAPIPPPTPLTSLVGREPEVAEIAALLRDPAVRLLTLTGPGGVGKTRLAMRVAEAVQPAFLHGIAFADLAPLDDPGLVLPTVAAALGVREAVAQKLTEQLAAVLRDRQVLLLLDNVEHVADAAPELARLVAACPGLTVLATSRGPLRLAGEHAYPVPPLGIPDPAEGRDPATVARSEAGALFAARARAADPAFALDADTAETVGELCRRLDGLPLAIELAAARLRLLSPADLLARLDRPLALLAGGPRDLPDRQRTMRATVAWSFGLLVPGEQALFRRLAVFAGGFTLEAAEAVGIGTDGEGGLDGIVALLDAGLVRRDEPAAGGGTPEHRYRLLEPVREFAGERLAESGEAEVVAHAYAAYHLGAMDQVARDLRRGARQRLDRIAADLPDLRAAFAWTLNAGMPHAALLLVEATAPFWLCRKGAAEGRDWAERALAAAGNSASVDRAAALTAAGTLALELGDLDSAVGQLEAALALYSKLGDRAGAAEASRVLGMAVVTAGDTARGEALLAGAAEELRELGDASRASEALQGLGIVRMDRHRDLDGAAACFGEALALVRGTEDESNIAYALGNLGGLARYQGEPDVAAGYLRDSLARAWAEEDLRLLVFLLEQLAGIAVGDGSSTRAARWLGAAGVLRERLGVAYTTAEQVGYPPGDRASFDADTAAARAAAGEAAFADAWSSGRSASLGVVVAEALAAPINPSPPTG